MLNLLMRKIAKGKIAKNVFKINFVCYSIGKDFKTLEQLSQSKLYQIIKQEKGCKLIDAILDADFKDKTNIQLTLQFLTSFDLTNQQIDKLQLRKLFHFYINNLDKLFDSPKNVLFTLHALSKFYQQTGVSLNIDILLEQLNHEDTINLIKQISYQNVIHLTNSLQTLLQNQSMDFVLYFNKVLEPLILININKYRFDDHLMLLKIISQSESKNIQLVDAIILNMENIDSIERDEMVSLVYYLDQNEYRNKDLYIEIMEKILQEQKVEMLDIKEDDIQITREHELLKEKQKKMESTKDPIEKNKLESEIEVDQKNIEQIYQGLTKTKEIEDSFAVSVYVQLLHIVVNQIPDQNDIVKELFFRISRNMQDLERNAYLQLWQILPRVNQEENGMVLESVIKFIKKFGVKDTKLSLKGFSGEELMIIFESLVELKDQDIQYIHLLLNLLLSKLQELSENKLVTLFVKFFVYSDIFQNYYHIIHKELLS